MPQIQSFIFCRQFQHRIEYSRFSRFSPTFLTDQHENRAGENAPTNVSAGARRLVSRWDAGITGLASLPASRQHSSERQ